jgi:hypothetical protein
MSLKIIRSLKLSHVTYSVQTLSVQIQTPFSLLWFEDRRKGTSRLQRSQNIFLKILATLKIINLTTSV